MLKTIYPHPQLKPFVHTKPFEQMSDIMRLQSRHLMHILLRMGTFSREDYERRTIPAATLIYCTYFGLFTWTTIAFGVAVFMQWMPTYSSILGAAVGVSHYDRFSLMGTTSFLLMEYLWYGAFSRLMFDDSRRSYPPLELMFEYEAKLDAELDSLTKRNFIRWYSRAHLAVITYLHFVWTGIAVQSAYVSWLVLRHYLHGQIWLLEVPLYVFLLSHSHFLGAFSVVISSTFYTDLFFLVKVFKYKLARCFTCLHVLRLSPPVVSWPVYVQRFDQGYMHLHRQLNAYNEFSQKLIYMCDLIFKCAGSITFSFFAAKQGGAAVNSSTSLLITTMFLVSYAGLQLLFTYLAYFPEENLRAFKAVTGIAAQNGAHCHRSQSQSSASSIRSLLKLNMQAQFLAKNKFAFTYTSHYCIQKTNIIENVCANFYFLTLFYRKFV